MDAAEMWDVIGSERALTADTLASLGAEQWETPTLCAGWTVRTLAAHLGFGPRASAGGVLVEMIRARGSFNRMVDTTARRAADRPANELVADLRAAVGSRRLAPGQSIHNALLDILVHSQDLAIPLGLDRPMPAAAAKAAAEDVWRHGFPFYPRRRLRGLQLTATDVPWTVGDGDRVEGPIWALLLLVTGRRAAVGHLWGPGAARLSAEPARVDTAP